MLSIKLNYPAEERWLSIGIMNGMHWSTIWTPHNGNTRIISVRRSREKEVEAYEDQDR
ncbi:BrnT family toxin [Bifidobacterium avesanii]|uniref:BrnT family toxin n=1 Tax=Bifidobacterium avesanii TaxID=1798157 RepID=UPI001952D834